MSFDPITLEILSSKIAASAEEMSFTLQRTGRTLFVKETADFQTGIADLSGQLLQGHQRPRGSHLLLRPRRERRHELIQLLPQRTIHVLSPQPCPA